MHTPIHPSRKNAKTSSPTNHLHESRSSATTALSRHPAIAWSKSLPRSRRKPLQEGQLVTVVEHRQEPGILPIHKLTREEPSIPQHPRPLTYQLMLHLHTHTLHIQLLVRFAILSNFFSPLMSKAVLYFTNNNIFNSPGCYKHYHLLVSPLHFVHQSGGG